MKKYCLKISILVLLIIYNQNAICQCYEDWNLKPEIANEPVFYLANILNISFNDEKPSLIKIDTSNLSPSIFYPEILSNKNFGLFYKDSLLPDGKIVQHCFIKNISSQVVSSVGYGIEKYSIDLKNCFIRMFIQPKNHWKISVFSYKNSTVSCYNLIFNEPIGSNDTCLYLMPSEFKIGRKKYKKGTIISLNENGIKIVRPADTNYFTSSNKCIFYSNPFKIYRSFLYEMEKNCSKEYHYSIKVYYEDMLVDSFDEIHSYFSKPFITIRGDTLIYQSCDNNYHKYIGANYSENWIPKKWSDSIPIIKLSESGRIGYYGYYNKGDLLLVKLKCYSTDREGLKLKSERLFTLNDIPFREESSSYYLVLAFDIRKNKFLGYPSLEFTNR